MMSSPPSQFNYPLPKVGITASQVGTRITVLIGGSFQQDIWIELNNESPYVLSIFSSQGILLQSLQPQIVDIAQIPSGDNFFTIVPNILIPGASPTSEVDINIYPFEKPDGPYPFPLNRQSAPVSGATNNGFTEFFNFATANANAIAVNLFNPLTSGINAQFYHVFISLQVASGTPLVSFGFKKGADNALGGGGFAPVGNDTLAATKLVNSTSLNSGLLIINTNWEQIEITGTTQFSYFFVAPNDFKQVPPGVNVSILIQALPATGSTGYIVAKHIER